MHEPNFFIQIPADNLLLPTHIDHKGKKEKHTSTTQRMMGEIVLDAKSPGRIIFLGCQNPREIIGLELLPGKKGRD